MSQRKLLIDQVESSSLINDRFSHAKCLTVLDENRRGVLSLVFSAYDEIEETKVLLKFYDPDRYIDNYRVEAFKREPDIIRGVMSSSRCLNLVEGLSTFHLKFPGPADEEISTPQLYFVIEFIEEDIDQYFYDDANAYTALSKLSVFRQIVLAVFALHNNNVQHRDIKVDNLRRRGKKETDEVVAIDLGTSVFFSSPNILDSYSQSPGAPGYAAPEARSGLAGAREIGHLNDIYALGAILFELFNNDQLFVVNAKNPYYEHCISALTGMVSIAASSEERVRVWLESVKQFIHILAPPGLLQDDHSVPNAITSDLDSLCSAFCCADFSKRLCDQDKILKKIDSCCRKLSNIYFEKKALEKKREFRKNRIEKIKRREKRIEKYLRQKVHRRVRR